MPGKMFNLCLVEKLTKYLQVPSGLKQILQ